MSFHPPPSPSRSPTRSPVFVTLITSKLYFGHAPSPSWQPPHTKAADRDYLNTDRQLVYEPFFGDFGPLNLACAYRFCHAIEKRMKAPTPVPVYYYSSGSQEHKSNSATLIGIYCLLYESMSAASVYALLKPLEPFAPFRDASTGPNMFPLTVFQVLKGVEKANKCGFIDLKAFNVEEYEHFEQVENGDLNVVVPGKFVAFAGPRADEPLTGPAAVAAELQSKVKQLKSIFELYGVTAVVRLNKRVYDSRDFAPLEHFELFFPDGSCPSQAIVDKFMEITKAAKGTVAVHCKAGLGRTGSLIGVYLIQEYGFSASEAIAWIRICRPGSVIGPQQTWLKMMEKRWRAEGAKKEKDIEEAKVDAPAKAPASPASKKKLTAHHSSPSPAAIPAVGRSTTTAAHRSTNALGQPVKKSFSNLPSTPGPKRSLAKQLGMTAPLTEQKRSASGGRRKTSAQTSASTAGV